MFYRSSFFVFPSSVGPNHSKKTVTFRILEERELFWVRSSEIETHDLKAERAYNEKLTSQVVTCYEKLARESQGKCSFDQNHFQLDKFNFIHPSSEYYPWNIARSQGEAIIYPAKIRAYYAVSKSIEECFLKRNIKEVSRTSFNYLYDLLSILEDVTNENYESYHFFSSGVHFSKKYSGTGRDREFLLGTIEIGNTELILREDDPVAIIR